MIANPFSNGKTYSSILPTSGQRIHDGIGLSNEGIGLWTKEYVLS
jgi:hypothetical protein